MHHRVRTHMSYANVVSTLALFLTLCGGAYAAARLPGNSVGSRQIKPRAVKTSDLGTGSVTSATVRDGTLSLRDLAPVRLPAGPQGPAGPAGVRGPAGPSGATKVVIRGGNFVTINPDEWKSALTSCLEGEKAVGGGVVVSNGTVNDLVATGSSPVDVNQDGTPDGWRGMGRNADSNNDNQGTVTVHADVVCMSP